MVAISANTTADEIRRQARLASSISDLQTQISSGKRLTKPSQDPTAWVQVSEIGRSQAEQAAWKSNIDYGTTRANKADSNLSQLNTALTRVRELMVAASTGTQSSSDKAATVEELGGLRTTITDLLNEKDYQGTPVFDETVTTKIPVGKGYNLEVVGTRQSVSEGINTGGSATTLDAIIAQAITAVQSGTQTDAATALSAVEKGVDHVILAQTLQGIRSQRLTDVGDTIDSTSVGLSEQRSKLEDTDLTTAVATLQSQLLSLEAAQAAFARINKQTLFDLIG
jgi:flagellar hook-associated protein 3 FlgL